MLISAPVLQSVTIIFTGPDSLTVFLSAHLNKSCILPLHVQNYLVVLMVYVTMTFFDFNFALLFVFLYSL